MNRIGEEVDYLIGLTYVEAFISELARVAPYKVRSSNYLILLNWKYWVFFVCFFWGGGGSFPILPLSSLRRIWRTQSNIYDGGFCENDQQLLAANSFSKKKSIIDVWLLCNYTLTNQLLLAYGVSVAKIK